MYYYTLQMSMCSCSTRARASQAACYKHGASRKPGRGPRIHSPHLTPAHCDPTLARGEQGGNNEMK